MHERLRLAILRGELAAGTTTSQTRLARDFAVGRTPLREALRLLQREGLVLAEPNQRLRIASLSPADAEGLFIMRIAVETVAVRITVPLLTSDDHATLEGYLAQMDHFWRVNDWARFRTPHRAFHQSLIARAGSRVQREVAELADHAERYRLQFGVLESWEERRAEHRGLLDAALSGEPELAARRLAMHYARAAALVFVALAPAYEPSHLRTAIEAVAPGAADVLACRLPAITHSSQTVLTRSPGRSSKP